MSSHETIVVGGGVIGLSIGAALSLRGERVTIIASDNAQGEFASGTPTGILMPWDGGKQSRERLTAFTYWDTWKDTIEKASGQSIHYSPHQALRIEEAPSSELNGLKPWQPTSETAEPFAPSLANAAALLLPAASLNTAALLAALCTIIKNSGGTIICDEVKEITFKNFAIDVLTTTHGTKYTAKQYVLAFGIGLFPYLELLGFDEILMGDGGEVLQCQGEGALSKAIYIDGYTIVPKESGTFWVAGIHRKFERTAQFVNEDEEKLFAIAQKVFGNKIQRKGRWAGVRTKLMNKAGPLVGRCPHATNAIIAVGHGTNGVLYSCITARDVVGLLNNCVYHSHNP